MRKRNNLPKVTEVGCGRARNQNSVSSMHMPALGHFVCAAWSAEILPFLQIK